MAQGNGSIGAGMLAGTDALDKPSGFFWNARDGIFRQVLDLSSAAVAKNSGDTNIVFKRPRGTLAPKFRVYSSVSLTTSTLAFGVAGTPGKYGAAKAYGTTPDVEVPWCVTTTLDDDPSSVEETIIMTIGTANLPGAGIIVIDMECLAAG